MLPTPINDLNNQNNSNSSDPANNSRQNRGTGFTNIGDILNANQGAGAKLGQAVGGSIAGQANSVQAGIKASQDQFNTDKSTATTAADNTISAGNQYVRGAGEDTNHYSERLTGVGTDGSAPDFSTMGKNLQSAAYNGPRSLSNGDQLNAQAANVTALGRLAGTSDGQAQLLRSQVAQNGQYSTGQNSLDSLLLGTGGQQYLQPAVSQASQVGSQANNAILNATAQANAASGAIDNSRTNVLHNLRASLTGTGTPDSTGNPNGITGLETDAKTAATKYTNEAQRLQQLIQGTDANGNIISAKGNGTDADTVLTDSDKALLANMSQYGINAGSIYSDPNNSAVTKSALGNYAHNLTTTGLGTQLYTDPQRTAAINLAKLLNDQQAQTDIAGQKFQKDIQSDTQAQQAQAAVDALKTGITGSIADNQRKASDLQRLINSYASSAGGQGNTWNTPFGDSQYNAYNSDTNLDNLSGAARGDLFNTLKNDTGLSIDDLSKGASNKRLSAILAPYLQKYSDAQNQQNSQLTHNTDSIQNTVLQRLLAGQ